MQRKTLHDAAPRAPHSFALSILCLLAFFSAPQGRCALPPQHSKSFPLRYECDVAPTLASWTATSASTSSAVHARNGWLSFTSTVPQITAFQNNAWIVAPNQSYTAEIRFRTPQRGRFSFIVDDGAVSREALSISSTGLLWNVNGVATSISAFDSGAMHTVRMAVWTDQAQRFVEIWQDGGLVHGPAVNTSPSASAAAVTTWGDPSAAEETILEIDYIRMTVGGAFAPFLPQLTAVRTPGAISISWPLAPRAVYQLETTPDLAAPAWTDLGPRLQSRQATASHSENTAAPSRFYRVAEIVDGAIDQSWTPAAAGLPPICTDLPAFNCTANCKDLVPFTPESGPGYENYPISGETPTDQYRSYVRREVRQAIQHAAARVECQTAYWPFGNNRPLGLGDMSEINGSVPGTREGAPAHPIGTHQNGRDIDVAYFQLDSTNNFIRPICETRVGGVDQYHCVAPPNTLDSWRTAYFVGILIQHPRLRVIGVDGQVGPALLQAINQLADAGWLPSTVTSVASQKLAFETADQGRGWYYFHHQQMHISFMD